MTTYSRTGKVVALLSAFNSAATIAEAMRSVANIVDEIRVYDGRLEGYRCTCGIDHDNSCDTTRDKVHGFWTSLDRITIAYKELPTMGELAKRNIMFDELSLGDTALVIEDDEIFYGDRTELRQFAVAPEVFGTFKAARMPVFGLGASDDSYVRVHVKTPGLRYVNYEHLDSEWEDEEGRLTNAQITKFDEARLAHLNGAGAGR